jgi:hypothetical protein
MSSNLTKPTKAGSSGVTPPARPTAVASPVVRPAARPAPPPVSDPFESEVPTSGIPLNEAMEMGLVGSQMFGKQPEPAPEGSGEDFDFGDEAESQTAVAAPDEGEEEDWGDGAAEVEDETQQEVVEEDDPFADIPEEPAQPVARPRPVAIPTKPTPVSPTKPALAPAGKKAYQMLQENDTLVFDTKLMADLSTVAAAQRVWDDLYKPFEDMTEAEKYTRNRAGEILVRDRINRFNSARLFAQALLDQGEIEEQADPEDLFVTMRLGKDEAQAPEGSDLGHVDPQNEMMEKCHNRKVGCNAMKLNHLQGNGRCFYPDCPCKGQCQSFVSKEQAQAAGGEAAQEGMKSQQPTQQGQQGQAGNPVQPKAQPTVQRAGTIATGRAATGAGANAGATQGQGQRPQAASGGTQAQGSGGAGAGQNKPASQTPSTQVGVRPTNSQAGVGVQKPQQTQAGQPQASNQAGVTRPVAGSKTAQQQQGVDRANTQAKPEKGSEEEPLITGDLLAHMVDSGGRGPEHSDYWPTTVNPDESDMGLERKEYIINRFVKFYQNAITTEVDLGQGKQRVLNTKDFNLKSNSYRVVLAANRVNEAIQMYIAAPQETGYIEEPVDAKGLTPTDNEIIKNVVGPAAVAYIEAHRYLPPNELDCQWGEYLDYIEAFKENGLQMGMLIHEWQKTQQAQA